MKNSTAIALLSAAILAVTCWQFTTSKVSKGPYPDSQSAFARIAIHEQIPKHIEAYRSSSGRYPSNTEGLHVLDLKEYSGSTLLDPWQRPYHYRYPATHSERAYDIWSLGPDPDNSRDDIKNWK